MTIDEPSLGPPPPSAEAVQLAELRRAELMSITRSQSSPWWMPIATGSVIAADVWAFSLSAAIRDVIITILGVSSLGLVLVLQRQAGIVQLRTRGLRGLATPSYLAFAYLAVGAASLAILWRWLAWPAVAVLGFALGASAQLLLRRKMAAAVQRVEAEAFGPPSEVGR